MMGQHKICPLILLLAAPLLELVFVHCEAAPDNSVWSLRNLGDIRPVSVGSESVTEVPSRDSFRSLSMSFVPLGISHRVGTRGSFCSSPIWVESFFSFLCPILSSFSSGRWIQSRIGSGVSRCPSGSSMLWASTRAASTSVGMSVNSLNSEAYTGPAYSAS